MSANTEIRFTFRFLMSLFFPEFMNRILTERICKSDFGNTFPFEPELRVLKHLIPKDRPFFDIGANYGIYSIIAADILGSDLVYSFEPYPANFNELYRRRKGINCYKLGMSDIKGERNLRIPIILKKRNTCRASLEETIEERMQTGVQTFQIKTSTIDEFVKEYKIKALGFLKIDVEGHEEKVILGASQSIIKFKPVMLIEIEQRHHQDSIGLIFKKIEELGYLTYYFNFYKRKLLPVNDFCIERDQAIPNQKTKLYINDFFFLPKINFSEDYLNSINSCLENE